MRVEETNEETKEKRWVWKESRAVNLTFKIMESPPHVYFCNMKIEVSTFVAAIRQCYNYGTFGLNKFYAKEKQCFSCGKANHEGSCVEATKGTLNIIKGTSPFSKCYEDGGSEIILRQVKAVKSQANRLYKTRENDNGR
jgi:hypothetical protein